MEFEEFDLETTWHTTMDVTCETLGGFQRALQLLNALNAADDTWWNYPRDKMPIQMRFTVEILYPKDEPASKGQEAER